jgi:hypothetical protein
MLKGSQGVAHAEKHDKRFKESSSSFEGSFLLVIIVNLNIVITPSYIEFAKEFHTLDIFNTFCKIW